MKISFWRKYRAISIERRSAIWYLICSLFQNGIAIITIPIFTRILTTEEYGQVSKFNSWVGIFVILVSFNADSGIFFNLMAETDDIGKQKRIVTKLFGLVCALSFLYIFTCSLWRDFFEHILGMDGIICILMIGDAFFLCTIALFNAYSRYAFLYRNIIYVTIVKALLNPVLSFFLIKWMENHSTARILGIVLADALLGVIIICMVYIPETVFIDTKLWKRTLQFNIPLFPHFLSSAILNQGDRLMIARMVGDSETGIYSLGYSAASISTIFTSSLLATWTPYLYRKLKTGTEKNIYKKIEFLTGLMLLGCILVMLIAPELIAVFAPKKYAQAVDIMPPVIIGNIFVFIYGAISNTENFYGKNMYISTATILAGVLNIVLNYIGISLFGYKAAAYTTLFCYVMMAFFHAFFLWKILGWEGMNHIVRMRYLIVLTILSIGVTIIINLLYPYSVIRYILLIAGILFTVAIYKRNPSFIKQITGREND